MVGTIGKQASRSSNSARRDAVDRFRPLVTLHEWARIAYRAAEEHSKL